MFNHRRHLGIKELVYKFLKIPILSFLSFLIFRVFRWTAFSGDIADGFEGGLVIYGVFGEGLYTSLP
jgi:hypothetical protein